MSRRRTRPACGAQRRDTAPRRRPYPKGFKLNLDAKPARTASLFRRTDKSDHVWLRARSFEMPEYRKQQLTRCEVDWRADENRYFALRRKDPSSQPLLLTIPDHRKHQPLKGEL